MIWSETPHSMAEQFIQCIYAWEVFCCQGVKVVHRAVWTLWAPGGGAGFYTLGQRFFLASSSDEIPR